MDISIVVPVYGCRAALPELHRRLCTVLVSIVDSFEIIMVDDCCPQNSWEEIERICEQDRRVIGIRLARNFGQIRAITAGLDKASGDWVVVMDCDLQDRPEEIISLWNKAQEGYDVVFAKRKGRKDSILTRSLSKAFFKIYDYFTDGYSDSSICNFSISKKVVIENYCKMREQNRAYTIFIRWLGFHQTVIELDADKRFEGKSSYNFKKKFRLGLEIITSQSNKPLIFSIIIGFMASIISFAYILYLVISIILHGSSQAGWPSLIASVYLMGGLILCAIGVSGIYIGNIFNEVKHRPLYVVKDMINDEMIVKEGE